jgi:hypothetical protein
VASADAGSSRRSLLARLAGGALAAVLATLGIGGFSAEDAEAKKKGGGRKRGGKKNAKTCEQKCNMRGKWKRGGKGKGGGKQKKSGQSKQACLAKCNPAAAGGGGGGTPATPGFPIAVDPDEFNVACPTGTCPSGFTCVAGACLRICTAGGTECLAGFTCENLVCVPADVAAGVTCNSGDDCDSGRCEGSLCVICPIASICGPSGSEQCCAVGANCVDQGGGNEICVLGS